MQFRFAKLLIFALLCCSAFAQSGWQERDKWQKPAEVMDALHVAVNSHVADVGAGTGYFTLRLAERVGSGGKVYAVDIDRESLNDLHKLADQNHLTQVQVVEGAPDSPHLPSDQLDAVLIVNAYHEFRQHDEILQAIGRALKAGGYLGIIEKADEPGEPRATYERRHHLPEQFVREDLARNGFPQVEKKPDFHPSADREGEVWYFLVAQKPAQELPK
jgi:ubiquinone/menaquinone biosynthesis C-methylase UbiE